MTTEPTSAKSSTNPRSIVFFHPDLGVGGAERLVVDAAVGLQSLGHQVTIFTSHCDPRHCFDEARDGTLDVRVRGNLIFPSSVLGRFHILCAILRQIHLILAITLFSKELLTLKPNVFIVDQLSACVPLLRWMYTGNERILFYCHFPDQLLAKRENGVSGLIKKIYRYSFDWFEGWSMSAADQIVVNSNFTKSVAQKTFPSITHNLGVIYPCVDTTSLTSTLPSDPDDKPLWPDHRYLLSINRFERKKSIELAIRAYHGLPSTLRQKTRLVLAGGYDPLVPENVQYHKDLIFIASSLGLTTATQRTVPTALKIPTDIQVLFLLSIPSTFKTTLLRHTSLLLYTPANEHFGIVPVEAMAAGVPVLVTNTGGPRETVVEGRTGWLRDPDDVPAWTGIMRHVLEDMTGPQRQAIGAAGRQRVKTQFGRDQMCRKFNDAIHAMLDEKRRDFVEWRDILLVLGVIGVVLVGVILVAEKMMGRGLVAPNRLNVGGGGGSGGSGPTATVSVIKTRAEL